MKYTEKYVEKVIKERESLLEALRYIAETDPESWRAPYSMTATAKIYLQSYDYENPNKWR